MVAAPPACRRRCWSRSYSGGRPGSWSAHQANPSRSLAICTWRGTTCSQSTSTAHHVDPDGPGPVRIRRPRRRARARNPSRHRSASPWSLNVAATTAFSTRSRQSCSILASSTDPFPPPASSTAAVDGPAPGRCPHRGVTRRSPPGQDGQGRHSEAGFDRQAAVDFATTLVAAVVAEPVMVTEPPEVPTPGQRPQTQGYVRLFGPAPDGAYVASVGPLEPAWLPHRSAAGLVRRATVTVSGLLASVSAGVATARTGEAPWLTLLQRAARCAAR